MAIEDMEEDELATVFDALAELDEAIAEFIEDVVAGDYE